MVTHSSPTSGYINIEIWGEGVVPDRRGLNISSIYGSMGSRATNGMLVNWLQEKTVSCVFHVQFSVFSCFSQHVRMLGRTAGLSCLGKMGSRSTKVMRRENELQNASQRCKVVGRICQCDLKKWLHQCWSRIFHQESPATS